MATKPYMPLMMGDWLQGTRGMKAEVKGVYLSLLIYQYDNGFIPDDMEELKLIEPEIEKCWEKLKIKFIQIAEGKLQNQKLEDVRNFFNKQSANGKNGGSGNKKSQIKAKPKAKSKLHNEYDIDNDLELKSDNDTEENISPEEKSFFEFWNLYDKKVGKDKAFLEWRKLSESEREAAMGYIPKYTLSKEKKYRKDPERFLKYKVWNDEIITENTNGTQNSQNGKYQNINRASTPITNNGINTPDF